MSTNIAICSIAKNENWYINDWVKYHLNLGFSHIYIYDNNDIESIGKYIDKRYEKFLTILDIHGKKNYQKVAYRDCFKNNHEKHDWIAFIDIDEFITIPDASKNVTDIIPSSAVVPFCSIALNWVIYNDGGNVWGNLAVPVYERFTQETSSTVRKNFIKSILNCRFLDLEPGCHTVNKNKDQSYEICDVNMKRISLNGICKKDIDLSTMYIRHYRTKTVSEFKVQKYNMKSATGDKIMEDNYFFCDNEMTDEKVNVLHVLDKEYVKNQLESTWTTRPIQTIAC